MASLVPDQIAGRREKKKKKISTSTFIPEKVLQIPTTHPALALKLVNETPCMTQVLSTQLPLNCDLE